MNEIDTSDRIIGLVLAALAILLLAWLISGAAQAAPECIDVCVCDPECTACTFESTCCEPGLSIACGWWCRPGIACERPDDRAAGGGRECSEVLNGDPACPSGEIAGLDVPSAAESAQEDPRVLSCDTPTAALKKPTELQAVSKG